MVTTSGSSASILKLVKDVEGPVLLHVVTEKGHGFQPAAEDPVFFHTASAVPPRGRWRRGGQEELDARVHECC